MTTDFGDRATRERAQGCLLGQLAGDALGSMVEFQSASSIVQAYPAGLRIIGPSPQWHTLAGQPTDDSELALALARALLQFGYADERVADAYGHWLRSDPFDVGGTIRTATHAILGAAVGEKAQAARTAANEESQANGALMRQSPLAIWGHALPAETLAEVVRADTRLTHPHGVCLDASTAFIVALAAVIRNGLAAKDAYASACAWHADHGTHAAVGEALDAAQHGPPRYKLQEGWVLIALQNAFYQALHAPTLEDGVVATVMGGGDTDTNAAIAGALLGAIHGAAAIPAQWRQTLLTCRPQQGVAGVERPRPEAFWPVDALYLAERLLVAGRDAAQADQYSGKPAAPAKTLPHHAGLARGAMPPPLAATAAATINSAAVQPVASPLDREPRLPARSRFIGALLGGAVGDALGRPMEGTRAKQGSRVTDFIPWRGWKGGPRGTITDDTQLTMCVVQCLVEHGRLDPEDLARRFVAWLPHGRGKGEATVKAVQRLTNGIPWYLAGEDSAGNGAAMRSAPVGLLRWNDPQRLRLEATLSALPTHRTPMAVAGAVAMAAATAWLLIREPDTWSPEEFIAAVQGAIFGLEHEPLPERRDPTVLSTLHDRLGELPALLSDDAERVFARLYNGAYVLESVPAALYCFLRTPHDVEEAILLAANAGFDADTVASMAGTLGGAFGGEDALPARWRDELEYRSELTEMAIRLHQLQSTAVIWNMPSGQTIQTIR